MTQIKISSLATRAGAARRTEPASADRGRAALRRLAQACVLLMVIVIMASAWLRLAQPRPPCTHWPACRSATGPTAPVATPAGWLASAVVIDTTRAIHRVAATLVLPIVLALAVIAVAQRQRRRDAVGLALVLPGLAIALALLGIVTPGSRAPAVLLGNQLGGFLMLGFAWRLACRLGAAQPVSPSLARWAAAGAVLLVVQAALGALSGAGGNGSGIPVTTAVAHLGLALVTVPWLIAVGDAARRQGRGAEGGALVVLALTQAVLGLAAGLAAAQPVMVLAHNLVAALGLALLLGLGGRAPEGAYRVGAGDQMPGMPSDSDHTAPARTASAVASGGP